MAVNPGDSLRSTPGYWVCVPAGDGWSVGFEGLWMVAGCRGTTHPDPHGAGQFLIQRDNSWAIHAMNPVRAGLVENWNDYPYLGSLHGRVQDVFPD